MKRYLSIIILLLISFSALAQKKTYRIGVLIDRYKPKIINVIHQQLKQNIQAVVGEDAHIIFDKKDILSNNADLEQSKTNYQTLLKRCDILLSFGTINAIILRSEKEFPKPTIVVGDLRDEGTTSELNKSNTSGVHNLLYLTYPETLLMRLQKLRSIASFESVGIVMQRKIAKAINYQAICQKALKSADFKYKIIEAESVEDIIKNLEGVDAIDLEGVLFSQADIKKLSNELIKRGIPSFSAMHKFDVQHGILATNISEDDFTQFFRRIALSIEAYVNGTNFSDLPTLINFNDKLIVNRRTAEALDIPMRYDMLGKINFIGSSEINPKAKVVYDLPHLIKAVLDKNLNLQAEDKGVAIKRQDLRTARSNYLPSLKVGATGVYLDPEVAKISNGTNPEISANGSVTVQQLLFSADAIANIKIQKELSKAQKEQFKTKELDAVFNSANAYFNALILKTNVKIRYNNLMLTERNLQIAEDNYKAGQAGKTDLLRLRSQMAQNKQSLVEAFNMLKKSLNAINQMTNTPIETTIDIKDANLNDNVFRAYNYDEVMLFFNEPELREVFTEFLVSEALRNAPELKQLQHNIRASEHNEAMNGAQRFLPNIALQGQYNRNLGKWGEGQTPMAGFPIKPIDDYNIAVNVSIPLFDGNRRNINRKKARLQREQLELSTKNAKTGISLNIHNIVLDLINEISNIELSKVSEASAKEAMELTQNAYSNGAVNIVQLIDAQNNYIATQEAKANATYNYLIKMLQLERYMGNYFLLDTKEDIQAFSQRFLDFASKHKLKDVELVKKAS